MFFACSITHYIKLLNVNTVGYGRFWEIPPLQTSTDGLRIANRQEGNCISCRQELFTSFLRCEDFWQAYILC